MFLVCLKINVLKPSEVVASKVGQNFLPSVYIIGIACFDECFLFHVIIERHYFLYKFIVTQRFFAATMLLFFETSVLKQLRILCPLSPE